MHSQTGEEVMRVTSTPHHLLSKDKNKIKTAILDTDIPLFGRNPTVSGNVLSKKKKKKK